MGSFKWFRMEWFRMDPFKCIQPIVMIEEGKLPLFTIIICWYPTINWITTLPHLLLPIIPNNNSYTSSYAHITRRGKHYSTPSHLVFKFQKVQLRRIQKVHNYHKIDREYRNTLYLDSMRSLHEAVREHNSTFILARVNINGILYPFLNPRFQLELVCSFLESYSLLKIPENR